MSHLSPARFSLSLLSGILFAFCLWSPPASGATAWKSLDGPLVPVLYPDHGGAPGVREVFARAWDQTLWHRIDDRGTWGQWERLDSRILQSNPAIGQFRTGALKVCARAGAANASTVVCLSMKDGRLTSGSSSLNPLWKDLGRPSGVELIGDPTVGHGVEDALEIVARTRAAVWHRGFSGPGRPRPSDRWQSLGLPPQRSSRPGDAVAAFDLPEGWYSMPVAATFHDRRVAVFLRMGGDLWYRAQRTPGDATWTEWTNLGSPHLSAGLASDPVVHTPVFAGSSILLFVSTRHGLGYLRETADGRLSGWNPLSQPPGGAPIGPPALAYIGNFINAFVITADGAAWQITTACNACDDWTDWVSLSAPASDFPRPITTPPTPNLPVVGLLSLRILRDMGPLGQADVFHLIAGASDGALWERKRTGANGAFSPWAPLGRPSPLKAVGRPAVIQEPGGQPVVFVLKEDGALYYKRRVIAPGPNFVISGQGPATTWSAWKTLGKPAGAALNSEPVVAAGLSNRIEVFIWAGDTLWYRTQVAAGGDGWSAWGSMSEFISSNVTNLGHIGDVAVSSGRLYLMTAYDRTIWGARRDDSTGQWDGFYWVVDSQLNQKPPGRHPGDPSLGFASNVAVAGGLGPFVIGAPGAGSGSFNIWTVDAGQWSDLKKQRGVYIDEIFVGHDSTLVPGVAPGVGLRLFAYGVDGLFDVKDGSCGDPQSQSCAALPPPAHPELWLVTAQDGQGRTALVTGSRDGAANGVRHLFFQGGSTSGWSGWLPFEEFWGIGLGQPALSANADGQVEVYFSDFNGSDGNVLFSTAAAALRPQP